MTFFKPFWDEDSGVYKVKAFNETHEFPDKESALHYCQELDAWLFQEEEDLDY